VLKQLIERGKLTPCLGQAEEAAQHARSTHRVACWRASIKTAQELTFPGLGAAGAV